MSGASSAVSSVGRSDVRSDVRSARKTRCQMRHVRCSPLLDSCALFVCVRAAHCILLFPFVRLLLFCAILGITLYFRQLAAEEAHTNEAHMLSVRVCWGHLRPQQPTTVAVLRGQRVLQRERE